MLGWCRDTLAACRRPFGIDHFDLAVAVTSASRRVDSLSYKKLRPLSLYGPAIEDQLGDLVTRLRPAGDGGPVLVSVALFSWGEATFASLSQP